jgi:hypothetical protein
MTYRPPFPHFSKPKRKVFFHIFRNLNAKCDGISDGQTVWSLYAHLRVHKNSITSLGSRVISFQTGRLVPNVLGWNSKTSKTKIKFNYYITWSDINTKLSRWIFLHLNIIVYWQLPVLFCWKLSLKIKSRSCTVDKNIKTTSNDCIAKSSLYPINNYIFIYRWFDTWHNMHGLRLNILQITKSENICEFARWFPFKHCLLSFRPFRTFS